MAKTGGQDRDGPSCLQGSEHMICFILRADIIQPDYRKIPKISPGLTFFKGPFEGLIFGGAYLRGEIDWASLIFGRKFTVFSLFYFVFEGNFQVQAPGGAYIWRGGLTEDFLRYEFGGLIFGGAYINGGAYFRNFTV